MTGRGKFVVTILILAVVGFGMYRWWTNRPRRPADHPHINPARSKNSRRRQAAGRRQQQTSRRTNAVSLIGSRAIPPVSGVSDYDRPMKDGKLVCVSINVWPGWAPHHRG